jgi:hypothetical protein
MSTVVWMGDLAVILNAEGEVDGKATAGKAAVRLHPRRGVEPRKRTGGRTSVGLGNLRRSENAGDKDEQDEHGLEGSAIRHRVSSSRIVACRSATRIS